MLQRAAPLPQFLRSQVCPMEQVLRKTASSAVNPEAQGVYNFLLTPKESRFDPVGRRVAEAAVQFGMPADLTCTA